VFTFLGHPVYEAFNIQTAWKYVNIKGSATLTNGRCVHSWCQHSVHRWRWSYPAVGWHYLSLGLYFPSQPQSITIYCLVKVSSAWADFTECIEQSSWQQLNRYWYWSLEMVCWMITLRGINNDFGQQLINTVLTLILCTKTEQYLSTEARDEQIWELQTI